MESRIPFRDGWGRNVTFLVASYHKRKASNSRHDELWRAVEDGNRAQDRQAGDTSATGVRSATAPHGGQSRLRNFESKRRISRYSQISVTISPKPAYHSMYFGAPAATPLSMKSKSSTRFSAAITTTKPLKAIPIGPEPLIVVK